MSNGQVEIFIPYNKILPEVYQDWFLNDIFDAEYFPLSEAVTNPIILYNIAISEGQYPVSATDVGYRIVVNTETQIPE